MFATNKGTRTLGRQDFSLSRKYRNLMDFAHQPPPACLLVDNGSLQPGSTIVLRRIAAVLGRRLKCQIDPVSLLHSNVVETTELEGKPAEILETAIRTRYAAGIQGFLIIPLFFGPSGALDDFIPQLLRKLAGDLPGLRIAVGEPVATANQTTDPRIAALLAENIRQVIREKAIGHPAVIVGDHGSPRPEVAAVRDRVARQLAAQLGDEVRIVSPASMERRRGEQFAFADPLLESALRSSKGLPGGDVVLALMFFSPGRHAGPKGDIDAICRAAELEHPGAHVYATPLVGEHPMLINILADRFTQLVSRESRH